MFPLNDLETLELFRWSKIGKMTFLSKMSQHLTSLVLYDCQDVHNNIEEIANCTQLQ